MTAPHPSEGHFDAQIARSLAASSAFYATHPRTPAEPSQDDFDMADLIQEPPC